MLNLPCNKNKLYKTLDYWSKNMLNFNFWEKGLGLVSPSHFFQEKCFSCYILWNDQIHCLIAFTSRGIGLYVFYNCFLTRLWRHKIWNKPYLFNQAVLIYDQKAKPKTSIFWERKAFSITFKGLSVAKSCLRHESAPLTIKILNDVRCFHC